MKVKQQRARLVLRWVTAWEYRAWNKSLPSRHTNGLGMYDQEMTSHYYSTYISVLEVQFTGS